MLPFSVRFKAGEPVYTQVVYAAVRAMVSGQLRMGDVFPSVRALSQELRINPNTAQKVIGALKEKGLLEVQPGVGTLVAKLLRVAVGMADHDRIDAGFETVTVGLLTRRQAEHGNGYDIGTVQCQQCVRRSNEVNAAPAVGQLIAHDFRNRQRRQGSLDCLLQSVGQRRAFGQAVKEKNFRLAVLFPAKFDND